MAFWDLKKRCYVSEWSPRRVVSQHRFNCTLTIHKEHKSNSSLYYLNVCYPRQYVDKNLIPRSECLKDTVARVLPFWYDQIVPEIKKGQRVVIAAHGNSLRALVKYLDDMSDADIMALNIPTGEPAGIVFSEKCLFVLLLFFNAMFT